MYKNVRQSKQNTSGKFIQSRLWEPKQETTKQRRLRHRADELLDRKHGPMDAGGSLSKGFIRHQIKERNRLFFASQEWYEFRMIVLQKKRFVCDQCGARCWVVQDVKLIMPISTHFHLRLNPLNATVRCSAGCCRTIKRERL